MINLNEKYNPETFANFLREFLPEDYEEKEQDIADLSTCKVIRKAREIGHSSSLDVTVLEMQHEKETDPRVAIATDAFKLLALYGIDKALVIFNNNDSDNYRFSYLTIKLDLDEKNKIKKTYSNARRYSFFLGKGARVKTPEQQLIKKGPVKDIEDLLSRFSLEVVNRQFYLEIAKYFDELVSPKTKSLELPFQSNENIRKAFAVRLIGRLVFCWFLKQKKSSNGQLIPDEVISSKAVTNNYYHEVVERLFFEILNTNIDDRDIRSELFDKVPYLNGGLFNPQREDYYDLDKSTFASRYINTLKVSDGWFKSFFELLETYNFTIDENTTFDQELSVDPEMLGRIFENLLAEINPETGTSERKRTGSYYTPRQIVEHMVDNSLVEYLESKTSIEKPKLMALVSYDLADDKKSPLTDSDRLAVVDAIDTLKVLDPACGSGAFPIGTLQKIVHILQTVDPAGILWRNKKLQNVPDLYRQKIEAEFNSRTLDYIRKLEVIKNSIFGVDIQPIAVDVSRLRCFLTLVVEEEIDDTKKNRGVEALPNLDFKFVCANTLVPAPEKSEGGTDGLFGDDFQERLAISVDKYFSSTGENKRSANNEIHKLIDGKVEEKLKHVKDLISFNGDKKIEAALAKANKKQIDQHSRIMTLWDSYKNIFENKRVDFFDTKYFFPGVKDGFDIVIGNPPYIDSETMVRDQPETRIFYSEIYNTTKGNWDLFVVFIERGFQLLNKTGCLSYIVPNKLIAAKYTETLRHFLIKNEVRYLRDYSDVNVFKEASVYPIVFLVSKSLNGNAVNITKMLDIERVGVQNLIEIGFFNSDINWDKYFIDKTKLDLIFKIGNNKELQSYNKLIMGAATVTEAYQIKECVKELGDSTQLQYKKLINSGTIDPYKSLWGIKKTQYIKASYERPIVEANALKSISNTRYDQANSKKLIIAGMSKNLEVFYDEGEYIPGKSTTIILDNKGTDLRFLQAILNSKTVSFWYQIYFSSLSLAGGYLRISNNEIKKIPIPECDEKIYRQIIDKVILINEQEKQSVDTTQIRSELDAVIMNLYGLSDSEKEIVMNFGS